MPVDNSPLWTENASDRQGTSGIINGPGATRYTKQSGEAQRELIKRVVFFPVVIVAREKSGGLYTLGRLSRPRKYSNESRVGGSFREQLTRVSRVSERLRATSRAKIYEREGQKHHRGGWLEKETRKAT